MRPRDAATATLRQGRTMAAPSRESTGRLVTDSTFTLPYAYPSSADYSIESQFDDVPGPYRRQRGTFG